MFGKPKAKKRKSQISPWFVILKIEMNSKIFCGFLSLFCFHLKLTLESFIQRKISTKEFKQKKGLGSVLDKILTKLDKILKRTKKMKVEIPTKPDSYGSRR